MIIADIGSRFNLSVTGCLPLSICRINTVNTKNIWRNSVPFIAKGHEFEVKKAPDYIVINDLRGSHPVIVNNLYSLDYHEFVSKTYLF